MEMTIPSKIRDLARDYYSYHGEKARVTDKVHRTWFNGFYNVNDYAYVCKVTNAGDKTVYTIIVDEKDADGNLYVSEYDSSDDKMTLVDRWVHEYDHYDPEEEPWAD